VCVCVCVRARVCVCACVCEQSAEKTGLKREVKRYPRI